MDTRLLAEGCTSGDLYQSIDDAVGLPIEKTVQRYLPKDLAREVRKQAVRYIGDTISPPEETVAKKDLRGIYPGVPDPTPATAPGTETMATLITKYHQLIREMRTIGIPDPE